MPDGLMENIKSLVKSQDSSIVVTISSASSRKRPAQTPSSPTMIATSSGSSTGSRPEPLEKKRKGLRMLVVYI